jgi:hypothetical protein
MAERSALPPGAFSGDSCLTGRPLQAKADLSNGQQDPALPVKNEAT